MSPPILSLSERFHSRYIPEPNSGCWLWTGDIDSRGYGRISLNGGKKGPVTGAHRASLILVGIKLSDEDVVCHRCDVPLCVNPDHLMVGTQKDNIADAASKGRLSRGPKHWEATKANWKCPPIKRGEEHPNFGKRARYCKRGHAMDGSNLEIGHDGHRRCRTCKNARALSYYHQKAGRITIKELR